MGIHVFEYGRLQLAIDYEDNRSLFVVTSCALVVQTYFDPDDERMGMATLPLGEFLSSSIYFTLFNPLVSKTG